MSDLDTATKECLARVAKAYVHRWLEDDPAATDKLIELATQEIFEHLKMAYILGRVDQDTARLTDQRPEDPTDPVRGPYVVHHLRNGMSACEISTEHGVPGNWPPGHRWEAAWEEVNCTACRAYLARVCGG
jgi:hypothetical protein